MGVIALFRGTGLVCAAASSDMARLSGMDIIGRPASELWTDPDSLRVQACMRATIADGHARACSCIVSNEGTMGRVTVFPVVRDGRVWGVLTEWEPTGSSRLPARPLPVKAPEEPAPASH
jgi:hypothetical protein